ncbi:MAG TPA: hypothetical protein VN040_17175 [Pseudosphingobacterium sp.]|nr:hypothetical protein [Pseudosphingobacterium sp.]
MHYNSNRERETVEPICYEMSHISKVFEKVKSNILDYFQRYIDTDGGWAVTDDDISKLAKAFGSTAVPKAKPKNYKGTLTDLIKKAIKDFESDRQIYLEIFNEEALDEYSSDVGAFKNTVLRNEVPIIRKTLQNKLAKELDKYRIAFKDAQPGKLFNVSKKLVEIANEWERNWYDSAKFESIGDIDDLDYYDLDGEECNAFGVIGGGIKSTFIYKLFPFMFPVRSREAVYALWYLSNKETFGCREDSEFLMIDLEKNTTQQNYYYPYGIFAYYALQIYNELKRLFAKHDVDLPTEYRFVIVEDFLSFVARCHQDEIDFLKRNNRDYRYDD